MNAHGNENVAQMEEEEAAEEAEGQMVRLEGAN
jgi:hypothetical protein